MPEISIVVPVYKVENYLRRCVDSILGQSFADFELLLVDDGSPDRSGAICDEYALADSRVRVFHKENGGANSARRLGCAHATGTWLMFVDSDDTLPKEAVATLHGAVSSEIDIVIGAWQRNIGSKSYLLKMGVRGCIGSETYIKALLGQMVHVGPVGRIFRSVMLTDDVLEIPATITNNEDLIMNLRIASKVRCVRVLPLSVVYNYHCASSSASTRLMPIKCWDEAFRLMLSSVSPQYHEHVSHYIVYMLFRFRRVLDVHASAFYPSVQDLPLNSDGRVYFCALHKESLWAKLATFYVHSKKIVRNVVNMYCARLHKVCSISRKTNYVS